MMFNMSYTTPAEIAGTIEVAKPIRTLGVATDVHGKRWHIRGIYPDFVQAKPELLVHPFYTDTSTRSFGTVFETWEPYRVEVVDG